MNNVRIEDEINKTRVELYNSSRLLTSKEQCERTNKVATIIAKQLKLKIIRVKNNEYNPKKAV